MLYKLQYNLNFCFMHDAHLESGMKLRQWSNSASICNITVYVLSYKLIIYYL